MNYKVELEIAIPRDEMLKLFQDIEFMKIWQSTFQALVVIEGHPGEEGSKSKLTYLSKGKTSEIIETIVLKALPDRFDFLYEVKGVKNLVENVFIDKGDKMVWVAKHEFEFSGFMKLLGLMPKIFVKQTRKDMNAFKKYAEMSSNK